MRANLGARQYPGRVPAEPNETERRYAGASRRERDAGRRERLLATGLDMFGTAGYPATSVESLCSAAGVSTRNFYDHFANREQLLVGVYDEIVAGALAQVMAALGAVPRDAPVATWARAGLEA